MLFFLLCEAAKLGITERFFVGIGWAVSRSLGRLAIVAVRYGVAKLTCQVLFRRRRLAQIPQTFTKGTHRLGQAALDRIARRRRFAVDTSAIIGTCIPARCLLAPSSTGTGRSAGMLYRSFFATG